MKIYVTSNGCEVSQLYSEHVQQFFLKNNLDIIVTNAPKEADLLVLYGCALTKNKESNSLSIIEDLKIKMKPSARLVVWGCISKQSPEILASSYNEQMIPPTDLSYFEEIFEKTNNRPCTFRMSQPDAHTRLLPPPETYGLRATLLHSREPFQQFSLMNDLIFPRINWFSDKILFRNSSSPLFYIRVAQGCTSNCTYCSERLVWGRVKSRSTKEIISKMKTGLELGYNRFYLVAEDFGSYGVDLGDTSGIELLKEMINLNQEKKYTIMIDEMTPQFLEKRFSDFQKILATGKIESLGCQVESGSNRILKLMGRSYKAEDWRKLMTYINRKFPEVKLTTHFMVGFPGETNKDFEATLKLLDYPISFKDITIFKFSASSKVPASRLSEQIPESTKELRFRKLQSKFLHMRMLNKILSFGRLSAQRSKLSNTKKK